MRQRYQLFLLSPIWIPCMILGGALNHLSCRKPIWEWYREFKEVVKWAWNN